MGWRTVLRRPAMVALLLSLLLTGCESATPNQGPSQTPSPPGTTLETLRRPWAHPTVAGVCPVTTVVQEPDPGLAPLLGEGPARPAGLAAGAVLEYMAASDRTDWMDKSWGGQKVLWAVDPSVNGPVLIRGRRLDAPGDVAFEDPAVPHLLLNTTPYEGRAGGWRDYPSFTRLRAPGCYAYQVDTNGGTWSIVFVARIASL